jgi:hypothetical protein
LSAPTHSASIFDCSAFCALLKAAPSRPAVAFLTRAVTSLISSRRLS